MSEEMKLTASAFEHAVSQQTGRYEFKETKNGAWLFRCDGWLNISIILSNLSPLPSAAHWGKPVAWRVKDYADGWLLCYSEEAAQEQAENGNLIQPLYASPLPTVEVTEERVLKGARGIWDAGDTGLPFEMAPPSVVDGLLKQARAALTAALSQNKGEE